MVEQIQTLHPIPGKTNKRIALAKYTVVRNTLLSILADKPLTHTDLMEALYQQLKDSFEGGIQWYGETVKLDLEARHIIFRNEQKPPVYHIVNQSAVDHKV